MKLAVIFLFIICNTACAENRFWSEGSCIDEEKRYEGATRNFYNRGAGQAWKNTLGDWLDNYFTPQGDMPFSTTIIPTKSKLDSVEIDVTSLVELWQQGQIENQGFRLVNPLKKPLSFFSKDQNIVLYRPVLTILTSTGAHNIKAEFDTVLNKSTYTCLGLKPILNAKHPVLITFNIDSVKQTISKALLTFTLAEKNPTSIKLNVFATYIPSTWDAVYSGFSSYLLPFEPIGYFPDILFSTSFENNDWSSDWENTYRGQHKLVKTNKNENFKPLAGKALEVVIKKGEFLGIGATYPLPKNLKKAYFRYYLRLGSSWELNTTGKLPGFSGTYHNTSHRAGWGGRKSDGSNGWSARMFMAKTLSSNNVLPNTTPIGTYLYHADMKKIYGDVEYWNLNNESLLEKNKWYSIEQYIQLNTPNKQNGQLKAWVNGKLVYSNTTIRFSDNPAIGLENVWLNVYHGGKTKAPRDLTLYIDDLIIAKNYIGPRKSTNSSLNIAK